MYVFTITSDTILHGYIRREVRNIIPRMAV